MVLFCLEYQREYPAFVDFVVFAYQFYAFHVLEIANGLDCLDAGNVFFVDDCVQKSYGKLHDFCIIFNDRILLEKFFTFPSFSLFAF